MDPAIQDITKYMEERTGIKPEAIGAGSWMRAIKRRMESVGVAKPRAYLQKLMAFPSEFQELIELIVVPETWFFRDRAALDFLASHIKGREEEGRAKPWHILSMACASGEEAYSIAMALYDAGIALSRFTVDGVDISKKAIETARIAVYGPNSFRNKATLMHKGNFDKKNEGLIVHSHIRQRVKFFVANVTSPQFASSNKSYDAIFCRNVLIYFDSQAQGQVFSCCDTLLDEEGLLFLGQAEREQARLAGFVPVGPRNACVFSCRPKRIGGGRLPGLEVTPPLPFQKVQQEVVPVKPKQTVPVSNRKEPNDGRVELFQKAMRMADEGEIQESIELCQHYIDRYEANAQVYYLLGALHLAGHNDQEANDFLERALYLDPDHYESLVNLALIAERNGNQTRADLYWRRARKQFAVVEEAAEVSVASEIGSDDHDQ